MVFIVKLFLSFWVFSFCFKRNYGVRVCHKKFHAIANHSACNTRSPKYISGGVSETDIEIIVRTHNELRNNVTPPACNMRKMYWDDDLASTAQGHVDSCPSGHDPGRERLIPGGYFVGQNLAFGVTNWEVAVRLWYSEFKYFKYGQKNDFHKIGHYTQLVWAESYLVGCGLANCDGTVITNCNYAPGGNVGPLIDTPYEKCTTRAPLIDCKGKRCRNGAMMKKKACDCQCDKNQPQVYGPECDTNCSIPDKKKDCATMKSSKCFTGFFLVFVCPWKCKTCPYIDPTYSGSSFLKILNGFLLLQLFVSIIL